MVINMKKLILMMMVMFSLTSVYAEQADQTRGVGMTETDCPAGDDSARNTVPEGGPSDATDPVDGDSSTIDG